MTRLESVIMMFDVLYCFNIIGKKILDKKYTKIAIAYLVI